MSDVVGTISGGGVSGVGSTRNASSSSTSSAQTAQTEASSFELVDTTQSSSTTNASTSTAAASSLSVQTKMDPVAGPMLQYTNTGGDVIWQVPSALAVSYLRIGLTADGMSHRGETTSITA